MFPKFEKNKIIIKQIKNIKLQNFVSKFLINNKKPRFVWGVVYNIGLYT